MTGARVAPDADPAGLRPEPAFTFTLDGTPVTARPGETIAAALIAAGRTSWRTTALGRPRGLFCGIGLCFDCLVTVNGIDGERACLRPARPGDAVLTSVPDIAETSPPPLDADGPGVAGPVGDGPGPGGAP
jgi:hypothetical protein